MRFTPPMSTSATITVRIAPETIVDTVNSPPRNDTVEEGIISFTAEDMEFTCVKVPIPNSPTHIPNTANNTASHLNFGPRPRSI